MKLKEDLNPYFLSITKWIRQGISFEEVYDKFAVRIIYKSKPEKEKFIAWKIYSIVTDHFTPNPTRLRDWISCTKIHRI